MVKNTPANAGNMRDVGSLPGSGRFPGGGYGNPLQYSCLENSTDRGACWVIVRGVENSPTGLKHLALTCTCNNQLALSRPLPQRPQLLPYGPRPAANVCHEFFLEHVCSVLGVRVHKGLVAYYLKMAHCGDLTNKG